MATKGVNKVILVGNIGQDPEVRYMPNGNAVANLSLATSESWKDQGGQLQERTEWHRLTMYRRLAEIAGEYLRKGSQIYVEGKLQTRKWQDQSGQDKYTTEIIVDQMQMLGSKGGGQSEGSYSNQGQQRTQQAPQNQAPQNQAPQNQAPQNQAPQQSYNQQPQYANKPAQAAPNAPQTGAGGKPNQPQPMAEPDFDFDDDIPF